MNADTATYLAQLNARFYAENAASFSETRQSAWPGWERLAGFLPSSDAALDVLDVACGNMRFADFLESELPGRPIAYHGIDSCDGLVPCGRRGSYEHRDLIAGLLAADSSASALAPAPASASARAYDLVVCFGFFHHVPGAENRAGLLRQLVSATRPGGLVAVSFWRFLDDPRLAAKSQAATAQMLANRPELAAELDSGDRFLGWQQSGTFRYCHHFDATEIDALASGVAELATPLARYRADGRSGALNEYLVLRARNADAA